MRKRERERKIGHRIMDFCEIYGWQHLEPKKIMIFRTIIPTEDKSKQKSNNNNNYLLSIISNIKSKKAN